MLAGTCRRHRTSIRECADCVPQVSGRATFGTGGETGSGTLGLLRQPHDVVTKDAFRVRSTQDLAENWQSQVGVHPDLDQIAIAYSL